MNRVIYETVVVRVPKEAHKAIKKRAAAIKEQLADRKVGLNRAFDMLKPMRATPLQTLNNEQGQAEVAPLEVDRITRKAWDKVYNEGYPADDRDKTRPEGPGNV